MPIEKSKIIELALLADIYEAKCGRDEALFDRYLCWFPAPWQACSQAYDELRAMPNGGDYLTAWRRWGVRGVERVWNGENIWADIPPASIEE